MRSKKNYTYNEFKWAFLLLFIPLLFACNPTKRLTPNEKLFDGANITFTKAEFPKNKKELSEILEGEVRPKTNRPLKLWFYNLIGEVDKKKGFNYWVKYKLGEPPVLFKYSDAQRSRLIIKKRLQDEGYLNSIVRLDTTQSNQRVSSNYHISAEKRYKIGNIILPQGASPLDSIVRNHQKASHIKSNQYYKTENLSAERSRLVTLVSQNGFYGVNETDLFFYVDSFPQADSVAIYIRWKSSLDSQAMLRHYLGATRVYSTYSLIPPDNASFDTMQLKSIEIISTKRYFRNKLFVRAIKGKPGDLYDGRLQASTLNYLQNLDNFKFINVKYANSIKDDIPTVDRTFYLTPTNFRTVQYDFEANTRSGSYFGLSSAINYTDKNWKGGAEQFNLNFSVGAETQAGSSQSFINTLELTVGASLAIPSLWRFKPKKVYNDYVARTRFNLANTYQIRTGFFSINRLSGSVSYDWRSSIKIGHIFTPLSISQSSTSNVSDEFQLELDQNERLRNSLENVLILGGQYQFSFANQQSRKTKSHTSFTGRLALAGNIPGAVAGLFGSQKPYDIFGTRFSQFAKFDIDLRHYRPRRKHTWVFRLAGGAVKSYGNADVTPYSEQFFVGGSNSIRAFRIRQLGPGSYVNPDAETISFFDQTGDIKLEFNTEFRFDISSYLKGALFVDAGNIWTLDETSDDLRGGNFSINTFYDQIAVGSGLGLRVDFQFFVIRLDGAFPIRSAQLNQGFDWRFNEIDFGNSAWRADNLVLHLAIGYPF